MSADPNELLPRRLRRQCKAAASIALAILAGLFLACRREEGPAAPDSRVRDAPDGREPCEGGSIELDAPGARPRLEPPASEAPSTEGGAPDAAPDGKRLRVDRQEHRTGMPVRDNLLE